MSIARWSQPLRVLQKRASVLGRHSATQQNAQHPQHDSGAIKPKPYQVHFGLMGVLVFVVPGLLFGANLSKIFSAVFDNAVCAESSNEDSSLDRTLFFYKYFNS